VRYGDNVDNTVEQNSIVFSIIGMRWSTSAIYKGMRAVKLCINKILQFLTGGAA